MILQHRFTPVELAKQMQKLGLEPQALANAAGRARSVGWPDAANRLADLVEELGYSRIGWNVENSAFADACALNGGSRQSRTTHFISRGGHGKLRIAQEKQ